MKPHFPWPEGFQGAVSLTYDDAMSSQLALAAPDLQAHGLKGTFFISDRGGTVSKRMDSWAKVRGMGHELAAHTVNHPCCGPKTWLPWRDVLENYDESRMGQEFQSSATLLAALGARAPYTFAYTCGDTELGQPKRSFVPMVRKEYLAARTVESRYCDPFTEDLHLCATLHGNGKSAAELVALAEGVLETGAWAVFMFHGIDEGSLSVARDAHSALLRQLQGSAKRIWTAPFAEVAALLLRRREGLT